MQCEAIAKRTGRRCGRVAEAGSSYCGCHQPDRRARTREVVLRGGRPLPNPSSRGGPLEEVSDSHGMSGEIALLRRRIREAAVEEDWEAMRRSIETLVKAVKVQHVLEGRSSDNLAGSLSRVLDEIGNELGIPL